MNLSTGRLCGPQHLINKGEGMIIHLWQDGYRLSVLELQHVYIQMHFHNHHRLSLERA